MSLLTLNDIFSAVVERDEPRVMMHREAGRWLPISSRELYQKVAGVSRALTSWGISKGDRVAILSENRPEWTIADFASLLLGAVVVPIYTTLTAEQTAYILRDSGARMVFVSNGQHLQKVLSIQDQTVVEKVVVMDKVDWTRASLMSDLMREGGPYGQLQSDAAGRAIQPDALATIIYTSGTTGTPKGVMLTHGNIASNLSCSLSDFGIQRGMTSMSFLPLSHVTARHVDFAMLYHGVTLAYVPAVDQLPQALLEVKPTIFVGVPRVYEKIHTQVEARTKSALKRFVYKGALKVGRRYRSEILTGRRPRALEWRIADRLVFSQIRAGMGQARIFISGGAPPGREPAELYADVRIRIPEGYGLTETLPVTAVNTPKAPNI